MIQIQSFVFNPFQENTYILFDETLEALIIDPGCYDRDENQQLTDFISSNNLTVKLLINTHCHIDHVLGNAFIKEYYKVKLGIHQIEHSLLRAVKSYSSNYGFVNYQEAEPDYFLNEGDTIQFGTSKLQILFVPGHSPGHIALYNKEQDFCIAGDVLFNRSIGRTDLPGGDFETLIRSIHSKLFILPDNTTIWPGHGPKTTIGEEKRFNPFLRDNKMTFKKHIPNFITCLNLLSGCIGITEAFKGNLVSASLFIIAGAIFDFFDGFVARLLRASSPIGKDLDSLADVITFGLLPGIILFNMLTQTNELPLFLNYLPLIIVIFSALRLAKFNNDPRQTGSFIGVPTPANALLIGSLPLIAEFNKNLNLNSLIFNPYFIISLSIIMSSLLVSEIPLFALKFKTYGWKDNQIIYIFLLISVLLLILIKMAAIPLIVILYVILSVINNSLIKKTK